MTNWLCQPSNPHLSFRLGLPNCLSSRPTKTPAAARRPDRNLTNYYTVGKIDVHTSLWGVSGNAAVVLFGVGSLRILSLKTDLRPNSVVVGTEMGSGASSTCIV